jgi:riboflavin biosynthesis pyrimidine reductase
MPAAELVDEFRRHIAPVLLGAGKRFALLLAAPGLI